MQHEILLNSTPIETRVAVVEYGLVQDIFLERVTHHSFVGNVYLGRVCRVIVGIQACFVDIGLERAAFLHCRDIDSTGQTSDLPINRRVTEGQRLLVQVIKDPLSAKGAQLTTKISLAARHLVLMPFSTHIGVSRRIENAEIRQHLKMLASELLKSINFDAGLIIRAAGNGHSREDFEDDLTYLKRIWDSINLTQKTAKAPALIFKDLPLTQRLVRDHIRRDTARVWVDSIETFEQLKRFAQKYMPDTSDLIELYQGKGPIFDLYQVEDEIRKANRRRVELKSGAYLVIDRTEAMTTVDINTGPFVGTDTLEKTVFQVNSEAAIAIGRQMRIRNLAGTIVIDFIDMKDADHERQVLRTLQQSLGQDPVKTRIIGFNDVGLVVVTRKRTRESLSEALQENCPSCRGTGKTKSVVAVCYDIFRTVLKQSLEIDDESTTIIAAPAVIERLIDEESEALAELEGFISRPIKLQADITFTQERYEVVIS